MERSKSQQVTLKTSFNMRQKGATMKKTDLLVEN